MSTPSAGGRGSTLAGRLTRAGFADAARAARLLADAALAGVVDEPESLLGPLSEVADPDHALLALAKIAGACVSSADPAHTDVLRALLGPDAIIGVSTNNADEARAAEAGGADYVAVGAIFPTSSKDDTRPANLDRIKDVIIRNGFNVYPRDVEDVLLAHPEVTAAAVVGRPDPKVGEEVVAFVSVAPGSTLTPDRLVAHCKEHISAAKYPREVRIVDSIPLTSVLKTDRKALRAQLRPPSA